MELIVILILILVNGLFSMSEISITSARKSKLDVESKRGNKSAKRVIKVIGNPDNFLSTVQIAITAVGLITGIYSGESLIGPFGQFISSLGIDLSLSNVLARIIIVIAITYVTLVLGELFPKKIGLNTPERIAKIIVGPMNFLTKLFYPFVWLLTISTNTLMAIFGIKKKNNVATEEEIKGIINDSAELGEIQEVEHDIVDRVFSLGDRDVSSLMTHRTEFEWLDVDDGLDCVKEKLAQHVHYIYPVASKSLDKIVGVVYLKDLFSKMSSDTTVREIMREPQYLHESVSVYDALETFKENKIHYALIIDEFGVVEGIVTMNDILESLVGNASELETEDDEDEFVMRSDGSYLVGGQYSFYDFLSHFDLEELYQSNNFNTISGLILDITGTIPKIGDVIKWNIFTFEIVDLDSLRIDKILVTVSKDVNENKEEEK